MSPNFNQSNEQPTSDSNMQGQCASKCAKSWFASFKSTPARRVISAVLVMGLSGAITLLFWKKLQLVTGVPRTAYAVPEKVQKPEHKDKANEVLPDSSQKTAVQPD